MGLLPEREPRKNQYENPDEVSALKIERKEVVTPVLTQFKAQVHDDKGNNLIQTPQNQKLVIKIPAVSKESLEETSNKGDKGDSKTWWAASWIRTILKAIFLNKEVNYTNDTN